MRPEAPAALKALADRGYRLGVISNVLSLGQVNHNLQLYGLASRFDAIVTSSGLGTRKPNPRIFWEAARLIGLPPEACAYVGDTISRDVIGSRRAGYALAIQIRSFLTKVADGDSQTESPDFAVDSLLQVLDAVDHTVWQAAT
jgi:putative hydrolase of the HAD superfamily